MIAKRFILAPLAAILITITAVAAIAVEISDEDVAEMSSTIMFGAPDDVTKALKGLEARGKADVVAGLVLALRFRDDGTGISKTASKLTGQDITGWKQAVLWQEAHPEIMPHPSYRELKLKILQKIDPNFLRFLGKERGKQENLDIRLEEITWGGVPVDGIPSLDSPELIPAKDASYMKPDDLVFGIEINGDVRAYPLRIMGWHEMFNETIGGVPVALAYCTLCGAGILFETAVEGRDKPLVFGSSGFLYRSNKLMFDRETDSLWNQFTGEPVSGPLRGSGIKLKIRPVAITSWANWTEQHPDTKVLSLETGHRRNYASGYVYQSYFASPDLMFPTIVRNEETIKRKDYVFGIRGVAAAKAWPVEAFNGRHVINDAVGNRNLVLIGDALTRTVRAYDRKNLTFQETGNRNQITADGKTWTLTETALTAPDGTTLPRVAGHIAYWFAWDGYLGVDSDLYEAAKAN